MLLAAWGNGQAKCVEAAQGGAELLLSGAPHRAPVHDKDVYGCWRKARAPL